MCLGGHCVAAKALAHLGDQSDATLSARLVLALQSCLEFKWGLISISSSIRALSHCAIRVKRLRYASFATATAATATAATTAIAEVTCATILVAAPAAVAAAAADL